MVVPTLMDVTTLPADARPAWDAYCAMLETKAEHFDFLEHLEARYQNGGTRSLAETARLDTLLSAHDEAVREFSNRMKDLISTTPTAHAALIEMIGRANERLA